MKKQLSVIALCLVICTLFLTLAGCALLEPKDTSFSKAGMTITLNTGFSEQEIVSQTAYYVSQKAIVTALKEDGSTIADYTVADYARLVCEVNKLDGDTVVARTDMQNLLMKKK